MSDLDLDTRNGLPDSLTVLARDYPREAWERDPNFPGLVQFWLERHMMFRKLLDMIGEDTRAAIDRTADPDSYRARLARFGNLMLGQLHEHHQIEDMHYFPKLVGMDARLARGFEVLDSDHHALDALMREFAEGANAVLSGAGDAAAMHDAAGRFLPRAERFGELIRRHLEDEEDLVVPILLRYGAPGL
jgi:hemerythrin-like domain-containing protein